MLLNSLIFDGTSLTDYETFISGEGAYNSPARIGEMIHIPGRDGSLWIDENCFENITVEYPAFIGTPNEADFRTKMMNVRSFLGSRRSYCRLEDTYHPDEFRLAVFKDAIETEPQHYTRAGEFTIKFDCKPQRFLTSGELPQTFTAGNSVIDNPTLFDAKPIISVTGNGTVEIPPYAFTVSDNSGTLWIDSDIMEVYTLARDLEEWTDENDEVITDENASPILFYDKDLVTGAGDKVSFDNYKFPLIGPGRVPVRVGAGMSITIYPRWWRL